MDKDGLIKRIENKHRKFGNIHVSMEIRDQGQEPDECNLLSKDGEELCLESKDGKWVYPLTDLTKRELEFLIKEINRNTK